jgi:glutamate-5-semialdehyde dehydrogenase
MNAAYEPDLTAVMEAMGQAARAASRVLAQAPRRQKDQALRHAAEIIRARKAAILAANARDIELAKGRGLSSAMIDRLTLDPSRLAAIAQGLEVVADLEDPLGQIMAAWQRPNGLKFERVRVPLGVVGIIFESRPNVTVDAGALCLKSGNAVILRGGTDAKHTSAALHACMTEGLVNARLPEASVQLVASDDRAAVGLMLGGLSGTIDVIVPRGGKSLVARVQAEARVPVLAHLDGNCHLYIHRDANLAMALTISINAKLRRTGVCGAAETILFDQGYPAELIIRALLDAGCDVRGCSQIQALDPRVSAAIEADWGTEFLDTIIAARVVPDLDAAMAHIAQYGSHHTDAIITQDEAAATRFLAEVDSAIVLHNASTQFADGGEFGFGAEIGIATGRLHARGPVGLEQLTTYKYRVRGDGQIRP